MTIETADDAPEDFGIQANDAMAIKQTILHAVREGCSGETGTALSLANDLISAFQALDEAVFVRSNAETRFTKEVGANLAPRQDTAQ